MTVVRDVRGDRTRALLRLAQQLAGVELARVDDAAALLLDGEPSDSVQRRSTLNNDGSAIEVCESCAADGTRIRLIAEPAADSPDPLERLERGRRVLTRLAASAVDRGLAAVLQRGLASAFPGDPGVEPHLRRGILWIADTVPRRGIGLYLNQRWGPLEERWARTAAWWESVACASRASIRWADWQCQARVASVAIEGATLDDARAKVYFRLPGVRSPAPCGVALLSDPRIDSALLALVGDCALRSSGVVLSLGFSLASGRLADAKMDLCGHCLPWTPHDWVRRAVGAARALGVVPPDAMAAVPAGDADVAFVGVGIDAEHRTRFNVYLRPAAR